MNIFSHVFKKGLGYAVLALLPLTVSCASLTTKQPMKMTNVTAPRSVLINWAATHRQGSRAHLNIPELGGERAVQLENSYYSAAGKTCKRIRVHTNGQIDGTIVVCKNEGGEWFLVHEVIGGHQAGKLELTDE
jgi:hypothetical protein